MSVNRWMTEPVIHQLFRSIAVMPPNWLGDVVMAQPAMRAIALAYPDAEIVMQGRPWLADLLPFLNLPQARYQDESLACDAVFVFRNSFHSAWQAWRSGSQHRYGFRHEWRGWLLNHAFTPNLDMQTEHHREYFLDLVEQAGITVGEREVSMLAEAQEIESGKSLLQQHGLDAEKTVCIAPGAQFGGAKRYPSESYATVIQGLVYQGWQPLILGTEAEREIGEVCLNGIDTVSWNAAGETRLREALQMIAASRLMLCNDSGLMHVAAGLGRPTVGVFGATSPGRTAPSGQHIRLLYEPAECSPCLARECSVEGQPCMQNVTPEMVLKACLELLQT